MLHSPQLNRIRAKRLPLLSRLVIESASDGHHAPCTSSGSCSSRFPCWLAIFETLEVYPEHREATKVPGYRTLALTLCEA